MKLSLITATYNCAGTLGDCLESVASQTHDDIEHWIIDGGSTDGTLALVESRQQQVAGVVSEPDEGTYDALNKGLARVTGEVVGLLHADDVLAGPTVLSQVAAAFEDPAVEAVYGDLVYVARDDASRVIRHWQAGPFAPERLRWGWMPPHPTLYLRRSVYERFGGFDTAYRIAADYDFMLRVLTQLSGQVVYLPQVLVRMRLGGISNRSIRAILHESHETTAPYGPMVSADLGHSPGKTCPNCPSLSGVHDPLCLCPVRIRCTTDQLSPIRITFRLS